MIDATNVSPESLTSMVVSFDKGHVPPSLLSEVTPMEIILGESLLTPGLQTVVKCHSYINNIPAKNLNNFKNSTIEISLVRDILKKFNIKSDLQISQKVYRIENRTLMNDNIEQFTIHACDQTLLDDAVTLVSKPWKCTTPSMVVSDVLSTCAGAGIVDIEPSDPPRDYFADNIHPFQVVAQQANAALADVNDPSFVHYMTYENFGTHHFRSLRTLCRQSPIMEFFYDQAGKVYGGGYNNPFGIMRHSFPCDFDLLSDLLNGLDENGKDINSLVAFNPLIKTVTLFGSQVFGCGIGSGDIKNITTNLGSAQDQAMCPDYSQIYILKRQARMSLLEQNKISMRLTIPFCPILHAGKVIRASLYNKQDQNYHNYGSGDYLICSLMHNIKYGGFATTTIDCVTKSVGYGSTTKVF